MAGGDGGGEPVVDHRLGSMKKKWVGRTTPSLCIEFDMFCYI